MKITLDSFLAVLSKSGLLSPDKLSALRENFQAEYTGPPEGQPFADYLVAQSAITPWQAEKLLMGKHKGFFLGKYRLLALLGKGGMSSVYLAEHVLMRRRCAIKVLPAKRVNDTSYLGRFHREAQAVAALDHPNIVRAYDVDHEADGSVEIHFLVMEYVDGLSLLDLVNRDGRLDPAAAAEYIRQAALGLEHAHRAGLIHRDIKPGNLLVDGAGIVKVMDLGLARFFAGGDHDSESLTIQYDEKVLGTADYLAPEQAVDSHDVDARADIYSLGCTLYFLLVAHPPFSQGTLPQRLMAHQTKEPPPIEAERPDVPKSLLDIVRKMMAKQPGDRFATAGGVAEACLEWLQKHGGATWDEMRAKLAESGIEFGGSSNRVGTGSTRVPPEKGAQLASTSIDDRKSKSLSQPAAGKRAEPKRPQGTQTKPPAAAAAPDNELGAFLANLGGDGPKSSRPADAAPTIDTMPPSAAKPKQPHKKPTGATAVPTKPAAARKPVAVPKAAEFKPAANEPITEALLAEPVEAEVVAEAEAAEAAPHEAKPTATASPRRSRPGIPKQYLVYGGAAAGLLVAIVIAIVVFSGGDDGTSQSIAQPAGGQTGTSTNGENGTVPDDVPPPPTRPEPESPMEVSVGPEGNFATIGEAITFARDNPPLTDPNEPRLIKVAGGNIYAEGLSIQNWSHGMLHIRSEGAQPAVLKPEGAEPVIRIEGSSKVRIEGFKVDATGKAQAVQLSGAQNNVYLSQLEILGFTQVGIFGDRAAGFRSGRLQFHNLTLQTPQTAAAGFRLAAPVDPGFTGGVQNVTIADCRLLGSFGVGIEITGAQAENVIRKCRFHNVKSGLRLGLAGIELEALTIENNTFHHVGQGILIDQPPSTTKGVILRQNLFADLSETEVAFEAAGDAAQLDAFRAGSAVAFNATERSADAVKENTWDLFATNGQTGIAADFHSTDANAPNFLKPKNAALNAPAAPGGDKFIGALPP